MSSSVLENERLSDLLVQQATDGLNASEQAELERLLGAQPYEDSMRFEQTAAALVLASDLPLEELPPDLRARLESQADAFATREVAKVPRVTARKHSDMNRRTSQVVWWALAASIAVAAVGWWPRERLQLARESIAVNDPERHREELLTKRSTLRLPWERTRDQAARDLRGEVIWDPTTQRGYMSFQGLAANDPKRLQYQLWIFDGTRDERYPVDGGVFDIVDGGEPVWIPIAAKLPVREATRFVVTVEPPGGVVVSARQRIVAVTAFEASS